MQQLTFARPAFARLEQIRAEVLDATSIAAPLHRRCGAERLVVGRAAEFDRIEEFVRGLSGTGGTLLLTGEAGIGKSTMLQLAVDYARRAGVSVLSGRAIATAQRRRFARVLQRTTLPTELRRSIEVRLRALTN